MRVSDSQTLELHLYNYSYTFRNRQQFIAVKADLCGTSSMKFTRV